MVASPREKKKVKKEKTKQKFKHKINAPQFIFMILFNGF